jgi:TIR domain
MAAPVNPGAIAVFVSYSHEDETLRDKLATHLKLLERQGVIQQWHDRQILAGTEWKGEIDGNLESAQIILLLISADFLASDYCYDLEMGRALERHDAGTARVIPIVLRPVDNLWKAPFGKLQALPTDGKAVTLWENQDAAFADVAKGIRLAAEAWQRGDRGPVIQSGGIPEPPETPPTSPAAPASGRSQDNAQNNSGSSTGWQISVSGGTVNINPPPGPGAAQD